MRNYVPQALRSVAPKPKVELPKRTKLNSDQGLTNYYRECLLLTSQAAQYYAENLLDSQITMSERMLVQEQKNTLDKIVFGITEQLSEQAEERQYDRTTCLVEIIKLATFVHPKHFLAVQKFFVDKIRKLRKI